MIILSSKHLLHVTIINNKEELIQFLKKAHALNIKFRYAQNYLEPLRWFKDYQFPIKIWNDDECLSWSSFDYIEQK